jgi:hypothetical protein
MSENIKFSIYLYVFYRKFSDQVNILGDMMKHPYTLLADPNLPISIDESLCKAFKAHLIYVLIFNNSIVFSDSQAISSSNLRRLAARDGVIRDLFKNGRFHLAIRRGASEDNVAELLDLDNIQTSFLREGKLIYGQQYSGSGTELSFMEANSHIIPWTYWDVRNNYTTTCRNTLSKQFLPHLSDTDFEKFSNVLDEEDARDHGLGRAFLQYRFLDEMRKRSIILPDNAQDLIIDATDAPYISNLASMLDLSPIYSETQQKSFQILRGEKFEFVDATDPIYFRTTLDFVHYVEGLTMLDSDDIDFIQQSDVMKAYWKQQEIGFESESSIVEFQKAYIAVNILIEDRIISRFPGLKISTGTPQRREIRRKWAKAGAGSSAVLDLVCLALSWAGIPTPMAGTGYNVIFERIKSKWMPSEDERRFDEIAHHEIGRRALKQHLNKTKKNTTLNFQEGVLNIKSFEKEVMVTST